MKRISQKRIEHGWSRAELARRARMNPGTVGLIEAGRYLPYTGQLRKLARALGIPPGEAETLVDEIESLGARAQAAQAHQEGQPS